MGTEEASLVAQTVKTLPAMQEAQVQFLSQKDPLEMEMATHSSILAWRIPCTEEPGGLQSMRSQRDTRATDTFTLFMGAEILSYIISTLWSSPPQPWYDFAGPRERGFVLRFHCDAQLCKIVEGVEKVSLRLKMILYDKELFLIMKRSTARLYIVTLLI